MRKTCRLSLSWRERSLQRRWSYSSNRMPTLTTWTGGYSEKTSSSPTKTITWPDWSPTLGKRINSTLTKSIRSSRTSTSSDRSRTNGTGQKNKNSNKCTSMSSNKKRWNSCDKLPTCSRNSPKPLSSTFLSSGELIAKLQLLLRNSCAPQPGVDVLLMFYSLIILF